MVTLEQIDFEPPALEPPLVRDDVVILVGPDKGKTGRVLWVARVDGKAKCPGGNRWKAPNKWLEKHGENSTQSHLAAIIFWMSDKACHSWTPGLPLCGWATTKSCKTRRFHWDSRELFASIFVGGVLVQKPFPKQISHLFFNRNDIFIST